MTERIAPRDFEEMISCEVERRENELREMYRDYISDGCGGTFESFAREIIMIDEGLEV